MYTSSAVKLLSMLTWHFLKFCFSRRRQLLNCKKNSHGSETNWLSTSNSTRCPRLCLRQYVHLIQVPRRHQALLKLSYFRWQVLAGVWIPLTCRSKFWLQCTLSIIQTCCAINLKINSKVLFSLSINTLETTEISVVNRLIQWNYV